MNAMSVGLARLLEKRGRINQARALLFEVSACFTEGHNTPYLIEARELLGRLERDENPSPANKTHPPS